MSQRTTHRKPPAAPASLCARPSLRPWPWSSWRAASICRAKTRLQGGQILLHATPAGSFSPSDGREMESPPWRIDAAGAATVIQRFAAATAKQPLVIDHEHETLNKVTKG